MKIEQRLEKLERTVRSYHLAFGILGLALLGTTAIACSQQARAAQNDAAIPEVIRARKFEVVARNGKTLLKIDAFKLSSGRESGAITGYNDQLKQIWDLAVGDSGGGLITVFDGQTPLGGVSSVHIQAMPKTGGHLYMKNGLNKNVFWAGSGKTNTGMVVTFDVNGRPSASLP